MGRLGERDPNAGRWFVCGFCNKPFHRPGKWREFFFCNKSCAKMGQKKSPETRKKMSVSRAKLIASGYNSFARSRKMGSYPSRKTGTQEVFQSSYELAWMKHLDDDAGVLSWTKKHGIIIPYEQGTYVPDFLVERAEGKSLEEVKGRIFDQQKQAQKNAAAQKFCAEQGWAFRLVFHKDVAPYL